MKKDQRPFFALKMSKRKPKWDHLSTSKQNQKEQYVWQLKYPVNQKHMQDIITSRLLLELKYISSTYNMIIVFPL